MVAKISENLQQTKGTDPFWKLIFNENIPKKNTDPKENFLRMISDFAFLQF